MKRNASDDLLSPQLISQKRQCPYRSHLKDILISKSLMPPTDFTAFVSQHSTANVCCASTSRLEDLDWMTARLDFLADKMVKFDVSGNTVDIIGIEMAENSLFFDKYLHYNYISGTSNEPLVIPYIWEEFFQEVINFSYGYSINLNETNCIELYQCADYLLLEKLRSLCLHFIQKSCKNSVTFSIKLWTQSRQYYLPELTQISFEELNSKFCKVVASFEWKELSADDAKHILRSDLLNSPSEMNVFRSIERWWADNKDNSKTIEQLEDLLCCIRIGRLNIVEQKELTLSKTVSDCPKYKQLLTDYPNISDEVAAFFSSHVELLSVVATPRQPHEIVFVFGGWCQSDGPKAACQVYDPQANQWTLWQPSEQQPKNHICQIEKRVYAGCVIVDNIVYIVGGYDGVSALKSIMSYDLVSQSGWYESSCMLERRYYVCAIELDGFLYAIGGHTGEVTPWNVNRLSSVERLNMKENTWSTVKSMNSVRSDAGAATLSGKIFVAGGFDGQNYHDSVEFYDPSTDQWTYVSRMNNRRGGVCLASFGNYLYAIGGNNGTQRLDVVEKFNEHSAEWLYAGRLTSKKSNLSTAIVRNQIVVIGGWTDEGEPGILSAVEAYTPETQQSVSLQSMGFSASATASCTLSNRIAATAYINRDFSILPWQTLQTPATKQQDGQDPKATNQTELQTDDEPSSLPQTISNESQPT